MTATADVVAAIRVKTSAGGFRHDLRAVRVVWQREMIRFTRDRLRIITSLIQPVLFLFVLGTGLSTITTGSTNDVNLRTFMYPGALSMGRALYRERMFEHARETFVEAVRVHTDSAEALAALGYTLHRLGDEAAARRELRAALELDTELYEARIYLGHLLYDAGDWGAALREFDRVPLSEHWDSLAVWRLIELKRAIHGIESGGAEVAIWEVRLEELESDVDPVDELLSEIENGGAESEEHEAPSNTQVHRLRLVDGRVYSGSYSDLLAQMKEACGRADESVAQFMRRHAAEERVRSGVQLPIENPEDFILTGARAGLWQLET